MVCPDSGAQQIRAACASPRSERVRPGLGATALVVAPAPARLSQWRRLDGAELSHGGAGGGRAWRVLGRDREQRESAWPAGALTGPGSKVRSNSQFHPWLSVNAAVSRVSISISAAMIRSRADRPYRSPLPAKSLHARAAPRHATALTRRPRRAQLRAPVLARSASLVKAAPTPAFALARVFAARALAWLPLSDTSSAERGAPAAWPWPLRSSRSSTNREPARCRLPRPFAEPGSAKSLGTDPRITACISVRNACCSLSAEGASRAPSELLSKPKAELRLWREQMGRLDFALDSVTMGHRLLRGSTNGGYR